MFILILAVEKQEINDVLDRLKEKIRYIRHPPLVKFIKEACYNLDKAIEWIDQYAKYLKNQEKKGFLPQNPPG